jgi:hypothetical protein
MTIPAAVGEPVLLSLTLADDSDNMYPQAKIYEGASSTLVDTIDLDHTILGKYEAEWNPTTVGTYTAVFSIFSDAGHTVELTPFVYSREVEQIIVMYNSNDDLASLVSRVLGLVHENAFIDNTVFDANGQLISARVRVYDSKTNVQAATDGGSEMTGLLYTYTIESEYELPGRMKQYRMMKE